jgi:hypothetical protein
VYFVVCTLAVKKKIRAGFGMSDRTIPLLEKLDQVVWTGFMWQAHVKTMITLRLYKMSDWWASQGRLSSTELQKKLSLRNGDALRGHAFSHEKQNPVGCIKFRYE